MSKLAKLIMDLCPDGVEHRKLSELGYFYGGLAGKSKEDFEDGNAKFITYKNVYANPSLNLEIQETVRVGKNEKQNVIEYGDVLFTGSSETPDECGMSSILTQQINSTLYLNSFCFGFRLNDPTIFIPDFLKHLLRSEELRNQISRTASGVTRFNVSKKKMEQVAIPLPPLPVQREIVRILDNFTELTAEITAELTAELTARKKQYEFYRDQLLAFGDEVEWKVLGALFPLIRNGFVGTVTPFFTNNENGVRYLQGTNIHNGIISDNEHYYVTKEFHHKHIRTQLEADDIVMVQSGHVGESAVVGEKYKGANCHALIVMSNGGKCNSRFINYYFLSTEGKNKLNRITTGGTVKHILASKMKQFSIPVASLEEQACIVSILDRFDTLCNDITTGLAAEIEARKKQYEYYRDKLLTFPEAKA